MKKLLILLLLASPVMAEVIVGPDSGWDGDGYGDNNALGVNSSGQISISLLSGEDDTNDVFRVEQQNLSSGTKTADAQIKASAGYVDNMVCHGNDTAATAGTIIVYDSLTETGTALLTVTVSASNLSLATLNFPIHAVASTGIYLGFTTTADVACTVSYR